MTLLLAPLLATLATLRHDPHPGPALLAAGYELCRGLEPRVARILERVCAGGEARLRNLRPAGAPEVVSAGYLVDCGTSARADWRHATTLRTARRLARGGVGA